MFLSPRLNDHGAIPFELCAPPWRASLTFGLSECRFRKTMEAVRNAVEEIIDVEALQYLKIRARRELHISWR